MYEVREQVINSAESHNDITRLRLSTHLKKHKAQRCNEALFCFFLIFEFFLNLVCILCLFAHEFVWEVDGNNWTCQRGLCAALSLLTQERLTSQRSGAKVIIEQIKVKSYENINFFLKRMISRISLGKINL